MEIMVRMGNHTKQPSEHVTDGPYAQIRSAVTAVITARRQSGSMGMLSEAPKVELFPLVVEINGKRFDLGIPPLLQPDQESWLSQKLVEISFAEMVRKN